MSISPAILHQFMNVGGGQKLTASSPALVSILATTVTAREGSNFDFIIQRSRSFAATISVRWTIVPDDAADFAGQPVTGIATFVPWEVSKIISGSTVNRPGTQGTRNFYVNLSEPEFCEIQPGSGSVAFQITDRPEATTPSLSIETIGSVVEEGSLASFTVYRALNTVIPCNGTVNFTADQLLDLSVGVVSVPVNFAAFEVQKTVSFQTFYRSGTQGDRSIYATVVGSASANVDSSNSIAVATIRDKADVISPRVGITSGVSGLLEGQTLSFTLTRDQNTTGACSVVWRLEAYDAADISGAVSGTVSFATLETTKTVNVVTVNRSGLQGSRNVGIAIDTPTGCVIDLSRRSWSAIISDLIPASPALMYVVAGVGDITEGQNASWQINRERNTATICSVPWNIVLGNPADSTGTLSGTASFAAGETQKIVNLLTVNLTGTQGSRAATLTLGTPVGGDVDPARDSAAVRISDSTGSWPPPDIPDPVSGLPAPFGISNDDIALRAYSGWMGSGIVVGAAGGHTNYQVSPADAGIASWGTWRSLRGGAPGDTSDITDSYMTTFGAYNFMSALQYQPDNVPLTWMYPLVPKNSIANSRNASGVWQNPNMWARMLDPADLRPTVVPVWTEFGERLVILRNRKRPTKPFSKIIISLGWELNMHWMPWSIGPDVVNFRKAAKLIIASIRTGLRNQDPSAENAVKIQLRLSPAVPRDVAASTGYHSPDTIFGDGLIDMVDEIGLSFHEKLGRTMSSHVRTVTVRSVVYTDKEFNLWLRGLWGENGYVYGADYIVDYAKSKQKKIGVTESNIQMIDGEVPASLFPTESANNYMDWMEANGRYLSAMLWLHGTPTRIVNNTTWAGAITVRSRVRGMKGL